MTEFDLQSLMQRALSAFQPERAAGVNATVQFHVTGSQGGDWVATVRDQKLSVEPGQAPNPDLMLSADTADIANILAGKLQPMQAVIQGKIQFKGDMSLAMRLLELFKLR